MEVAENSLVICHFMVVCVSVCVCYLSSERTGCKKNKKGEVRVSVSLLM